MYKRKLYLFGFTSAFIMVVALLCAAVAAHLTRTNLAQNNIAQALLVEHQQLSSISYRMFKQLTDELIFGQNANQAAIRNKRALIEQSLQKIRHLELQQREALGVEITQGSVEDTDELAQLLDSIIAEFKFIVSSNDNTPLNQQARVQQLLEVTIDDNFREAINSAVTRQSKVVSATNAQIETLNKAIVWFTIILGLFAFPFIILACYWLFNQLYQPLTIIRNGTEAIAAGNYQQRLPETLDAEFQALVHSLNQLASRLSEHELNEKQSRKQLEYEVEQRTRELTQANAQLTSIDSRRRQFIADISHELRTPLTIIRGEAQVTLRQAETSVQTYQETLNSILEQAINLSRLVDDLLLLARAEMSQLKLDKGHQRIAEIVKQQLAQWRRMYTSRDFTLHISPNADNVELLIDEQRFQQVMAILLDNACKYTTEKSPITVSLSTDKNNLNISVADAGSGISPADLEHIFERFVRFKSRTEGTGLGLTIAKAIVEAHGGEISARSSLGSGSTFTVTLPLDKEHTL